MKYNSVMPIDSKIFVETDPRLTDYDTLLNNLRDIKSGKQAEIPIYDFKSSSRIGYRFDYALLLLTSNSCLGSY